MVPPLYRNASSPRKGPLTARAYPTTCPLLLTPKAMGKDPSGSVPRSIAV
jgi:hypothetical protein